MIIKKSTQGMNYYLDPNVERFRYNPYRIRNRKLAEESFASNKTLPFPLHVIIETSSLCQLKCGFCNREVMSRPQQNMNFDVFRKVVDECAENFSYSLSLYALGEPFLNPEIREMVIYAKGRGLPYVDISTNGMLPVNNMIGTGLNELIVSLEGQAEIHEKLRPGAKFAKIVDNVSSLKTRREHLGMAYPIIRIQTINFPGPDKTDFINRAFEIGDVVYLKNVEGMPALGDRNIEQAEIDRRLKERTACKALWFTMTVNSNGDIAYCPHDPKAQTVIGNINSMTLKQAWDSMDKLRDNHREGIYTELCSKCVDWKW